MASKQPLSPRSQQGKRRSLLNAFPDLQIGSSSAPAGQQEYAPEGKGSFGRGWPPMSNSMRTKLSSTQSGLVCCLRERFSLFSILIDNAVLVPCSLLLVDVWQFRLRISYCKALSALLLIMVLDLYLIRCVCRQIIGFMTTVGAWTRVLGMSLQMCPPLLI